MLFCILGLMGNLSYGQSGVYFAKIKTYHSKKLGITFDYPANLKIREKKGVITIEHNIKFKHPDPCDGSGLPQYQFSNKIYDFYVQISIISKNMNIAFSSNPLLPNIVVIESDEISKIPVDGLATYGKLKGIWQYNGNHGCGPFTYLFQLTHDGLDNKDKFLKVNEYPAPEFNRSAVSDEDIQVYSRLRQILLPEQRKRIFSEILSSLKYGKK